MSCWGRTCTFHGFEIPASPSIEGDSTKTPSSDMLTFGDTSVLFDVFEREKNLGLFPNESFAKPFLNELPLE